MNARRPLAIRSFFACFICNALLLSAIYLALRLIFQGIHHYSGPFLADNGADNGIGLPLDALLALNNLDLFIRNIEHYLTPAIFGIGFLITLLMWVIILLAHPAYSPIEPNHS